MTATQETRPPLRIGSGVCECGGCAERFKSVTGFDRHRVGPGDARRCLTPAEMRGRGMTRNTHGQWITETRPGVA
jgi:hypothetical protein